VKSVMPSLK